MAKETKNNAKKTYTDPVTGKFVKGNPGGGRPPGKKNFETEWREFISKVAEDNGMTPKQINEQLYAVGWKKAKEGDYQFWRDIHDRLFGRAQQHVDHTTNGQDIHALIMSNHERAKQQRDSGGDTEGMAE